MSDTPRTDAISGWGVTYRGKSSSEELYIDPKGPFVHSTFARQLERELDEAKRDAARYQVVRRMNDSEFYELLQRCVRQDLRFDDEVDRIRGIK